LGDLHRPPERGEDYLSALLLRDLRDVEGDRGVHEDAGDEELLTLEDAHVVRLSVAGEGDSVAHADAAVDGDHGTADVWAPGAANERTPLRASPHTTAPHN